METVTRLAGEQRWWQRRGQWWWQQGWRARMPWQTAPPWWCSFLGLAVNAPPFLVGHVLSWCKRYVWNYVFAFCASGWGLLLSTKLLAGKVCVYVLCFFENKPVDKASVVLFVLFWFCSPPPHTIFWYDSTCQACQGHAPFWRLQESHSRQLASFHSGKNTPSLLSEGGLGRNHFVSTQPNFLRIKREPLVVCP